MQGTLYSSTSTANKYGPVNLICEARPSQKMDCIETHYATHTYHHSCPSINGHDTSLPVQTYHDSCA